MKAWWKSLTIWMHGAVLAVQTAVETLIQFAAMPSVVEIVEANFPPWARAVIAVINLLGIYYRLFRTSQALTVKAFVAGK